jgi:hypothetical protein
MSARHTRKFNSTVRLEPSAVLVSVIYKTYVRKPMKKGNIIIDYEKLLEERVEELTTELAQSITRELDLQEQLDTKYYYIIGVTASVNEMLINFEVRHHLFNDPISACKRLKSGWSIFRRDFKDRFESRGFVFKYYTIDSYNANYDPKDKLLPVRVKSWAFETLKEVEATIKNINNI